jgi:hypothetical protein
MAAMPRRPRRSRREPNMKLGWLTVVDMLLKLFAFMLLLVLAHST